MTRRAGLLAVFVALAAAPSAADAAVTASLSTVILTVQGDADPQTLTVTTDGTTVSVAGPIFAGDPDDGGTSCSISGDSRTVSCAEAAVLTVIARGGGGVDTISLARGAEPTYAEGEAGNDVLAYTGGTDDGQAFLRGGDDDDDLTVNGDPLDFGGQGVGADGGPGADTLRAGTNRLSGDDVGGPGADTFVGSGDRGDFFRVEDGADTYRGGQPSQDTIDYSPVSGVTVTLDDQPGDGRAGENDDVGSDIEQILATDGADAVTCAVASCTIQGGLGDDALTGGTGDDTLRGMGGADVLSGLGGDDELDDGDLTPSQSATPLPPGDADRLDGGPGEDELAADRGPDVLAGGPGTDQLKLDRPVTVPPASTDPPRWVSLSVSLDGVANDGAEGEGDDVRPDIERFLLGQGDDRFTGSAGPEHVEGQEGADTIDPGAGPDYVDAGTGADAVLAQDGVTDTIRCGADADAATLDLPGAQPERADVVTGCETVTGLGFPALPSPSPSPAPVPDRSGPAVTLRPRAITAKALRRTAKVRAAVTCDEACTVSGELETSKAKLATVGRLAIGKGRLPRGTGRRTLVLTVAKKYRRRALRRKVPLVVSVVATDAAGNETAASRKLRVKR